MGKKAAPTGAGLTGRRAEEVWLNAASTLDTAMRFSIIGAEQFTVGSVLVKAPEMVAQWRKTRGPADPFGDVSRAGLDALKALDVLDAVLQKHQVADAELVPASNPGSSTVAAGAATPHAPHPQNNNHLALVPVRRRAHGGNPVAPTAAGHIPEAALPWRLNPGCKALKQLLHTWLGDAWETTEHIRAIYWLLAFLATKLVPTVCLWSILLGGLAAILSFVANPVAVSTFCIRFFLRYLAALPVAGLEAVAQITAEVMQDITGVSFGTSAHCLDHSSSSFDQSFPPSQQSSTTHSLETHGKASPANPPPAHPAGQAHTAVLSLFTCVIGWCASKRFTAHQ